VPAPGFRDPRHGRPAILRPVSAKAMRRPLCLQQEIDMNTFEYEANQLSDDELDNVSGGRIKWSDIHMDYHNLPSPLSTEPAPTRYC
jgi:bacteriocin-like protein